MDIIYKAIFSVTGVAVLSFLIQIGLRQIFDFSSYSKPLAKIIGFSIASIGAFIFITFYNELRQIPVHPDQISIENITTELSTKRHLWVSIPDGKWDCNNMAFDGRNTFAVLLSKSETVIVVASFDENKTCQELHELQPSGKLSKFVRREFAYTSNHINLSKYGPTAAMLSLCAYCGRQNSEMGVAMGIFFSVFGLFYDKLAMWNPSHNRNTAALPPQPRDSMS